MIKIPSISPNDLGCQEILIGTLKKVGFLVERINFNNVKNFFASHGEKKGKVLLFVGHTDVVCPGSLKDWRYYPFDPVIKDNSIYGRGTADMKGAIASMILSAKEFVTSFPDHIGKLAFLITSDEEGSAKYGTKKVVEILKKRKEKIDYCIIGEPTSEFIVGDTIKNGRRGSLNLNLFLYGPQGHVAYLDPIKNPVNLVVPLLKKLIFRSNMIDKFSKNVSSQIVKISSNSYGNNITPSQVEIKMNFRFDKEINHDFVKQYISSEIEKHTSSYKLFWKLSAKPFEKKSKELIEIINKILIEKFSLFPKLSHSGGTSDGRFIIEICNQIVEIGLINQTIHQPNEMIEIQDLIRLNTIYLEIMKKILL
ncbi:succinyl-diaminopimelate desuccinylase [Candidatus Riesia pediculicola]|nr:succinyl-diaminopimelate desuccinylase [Candidatus Riesia pediculicola]